MSDCCKKRFHSLVDAALMASDVPTGTPAASGAPTEPGAKKRTPRPCYVKLGCWDARKPAVDNGGAPPADPPFVWIKYRSEIQHELSMACGYKDIEILFPPTWPMFCVDRLLDPIDELSVAPSGVPLKTTYGILEAP